MTDEEIRKAAGEYMNMPSVKAAIKCGDVEDLASHIKVAYANGIRYALENQWHDARKGDLPYKHTELLDDCEGTEYVFCISKKNTPYADYMLQSSKDGHWFWGKHNYFDCKYWMPIPTLPTKPKTPTK